MEAVQFPSFLRTMTAFDRRQIGDKINNICGGDLVFFSRHCHGGFIGRRMCEGKADKKETKRTSDRIDDFLCSLHRDTNDKRSRNRVC